MLPERKGARGAPPGYVPAIANPYGIALDDASLRWAAAEGVCEAVIAAICLLDQRSVDEIVAKLSPVELEHVIKIVGRSPRAYSPGAYEALKGKRNLASPQPPTERLAVKPGQPAARTNPDTEHRRRIPGHRFNAPRLEVPRPLPGVALPQLSKNPEHVPERAPKRLGGG